MAIMSKKWLVKAASSFISDLFMASSFEIPFVNIRQATSF